MKCPQLAGPACGQGLDNHSVLRSLLETARRQGRKPHEFLLALFTKNTAQAQAAPALARLRNTSPKSRSRETSQTISLRLELP